MARVNALGTGTLGAVQLSAGGVAAGLKSTSGVGSSLRVVSTSPYVLHDVELGGVDSSKAHSLHYVVPYPESTRPELPAYFISRFSKKDQVVLDPFAGIGTTALESVLMGRVAFCSDVNPLGVKIAQAKLLPADITEVTLALQMINFRRPVNLKGFDDIFSHYYDVETFRELVNLRGHVAESDDRTARFIEFIALGLLHGHSAGYFSVYTMPQISLSPTEQRQLNTKRRQAPDFRSVAPRILRRTAYALRDGSPSILRNLERKNRVCVADARNLSFVPSNSVDLVVTRPPLPTSGFSPSEVWLRLWFSNVSTQSFDSALFSGRSLEDWSEFMSEALFELSRTVRSGGRAVFELSEAVLAGRSISFDEELARVVRENFSRYWDVEGVVIPKQRNTALKSSLEGPELGGQARLLNGPGPTPRAGDTRILVIRKR